MLNDNRAIKAQEQKIARLERNVALERIKQRRADTRRKIEFGGLVIKSGISGHNKSVVLGALISAIRSIEIDKKNMELFEEIGNLAFLEG
jgi:hypothetical protein